MTDGALDDRMRQLRAEAQDRPIILSAGSTGTVVDKLTGERIGQIALLGQLPFSDGEWVAHIYLLQPSVLGKLLSELLHFASDRGGEYRSEARRHVRQALRETRLGI